MLLILPGDAGSFLQEQLAKRRKIGLEILGVWLSCAEHRAVLVMEAKREFRLQACVLDQALLA